MERGCVCVDIRINQAQTLARLHHAESPHTRGRPHGRNLDRCPDGRGSRRWPVRGDTRRGRVLLAAIAADAPSLDPHQEETFATIEVVAPCYSTLLQIDPYQYPKIIGDVATEWKIAPGGLTYTFKLRQGIRFHDGSALTSADVKATYEKIVFPPAGVRSIRKNSYAAITSIDTPTANTIVFKLKHPSASLLANLASPWNVIYPKKYLDKDPNYFKPHVIDSGPFKFTSHTRGRRSRGSGTPT